MLNSLNLRAAYGSSLFSKNYECLYNLQLAIKPKIENRKKSILINHSSTIELIKIGSSEIIAKDHKTCPIK